MKTINYAVIAALTSTWLITPAMANPPIFDTTGLTPQEVCDVQLNPNVNSGFTTFPENVSEGDWATVSTDIGDPVGLPYGVGTPTYSNIFLTSGFFRNGGSPNVWGGATATETYPQTGQLHETTLNQERTITFDCVVQKTNPAQTIEPAGLQSVGNTAVEEQQIPGDNQEQISETDFVTEGETVYALICISPNNSTKGKPGTWTGKNGFAAAGCPAASAAAGGTIPSSNAPVL
jgi:hypothetical protein